MPPTDDQPTGTPASPVAFEVVDPGSAGARLAIGRYVDELRRRFDFDPTGLDDHDTEALRAPDGVMVVASVGDRPIACGGVRTIAPGIGEIKRMWVDGERRGAGIGARLLHHLEAQALRLGHRLVRLDTNAALTEAIALYERHGYHAIGRYNDNPHATHFFEKPLAPARARQPDG